MQRRNSESWLDWLASQPDKKSTIDQQIDKKGSHFIILYLFMLVLKMINLSRTQLWHHATSAHVKHLHSAGFYLDHLLALLTIASLCFGAVVFEAQNVPR